MMEGFVNSAEIHSVEISVGDLIIKVSVQNALPTISCNINSEYVNDEPFFNVYVTAKDKELRRLWRSPIIDDTGTVKCYNSIEEALTDATGRLKEKDIPLLKDTNY